MSMKCPKCDRVYDDTWKICQNDATLLKSYSAEPSPEERIIMTTTSAIEGQPAEQYLGVVTGIAVFGFIALREMFSSFRDIGGGRSGSYEKEFKQAETTAMRDARQKALALGADAIVGLSLDYESIDAENKSFIMAVATGTAVKLSAHTGPRPVGTH